MTAPATVSAELALHIVVRVGAELFALPVAHVEEAIDAPVIEWVPVVPNGMLGQLPHRGRLISVWDAGWTFGLPRSAATAGAALVLRDGTRRVGLVVDDLTEIVRIEPADLRVVPGSTDADGLLSGVCFSGDDGHPLLNVVRVEAVTSLLFSRGSLNGEGAQ